MGGGGKADRLITWEEVRRHNIRTDRWVVVHQDIYNVTEFAKKHPGGSAILGHYAGQDATVSQIIYALSFNLANYIISRKRIFKKNNFKP